MKYILLLFIFELCGQLAFAQCAPSFTVIAYRNSCNDPFVVELQVEGISDEVLTWNGDTVESYIYDEAIVGNNQVVLSNEDGCLLDSTIIYDPFELLEVEVVLQCLDPDSNLKEATAIVTGGTEPYSFLWMTAATTNPIQTTWWGGAMVQVTDVNGCFDGASGFGGPHWCTTGVDDESNTSSRYQVYPNPSFGVVHVDGAANVQFELINPMGQSIESGVVDKQIDLSHQPKGYYYLKLTTDDEQFVQQLLIQ